MEVATNLSTQLQNYLDLSSAELKVTAGNMANIDTPGYRTQGFDFHQALESAIVDEGNGKPPTLAPRLEDVDHLIARPDGNNVSMDREGLKMAEAQLKFRTGVEVLKREYSRVLEAIQSDTK